MPAAVGRSDPRCGRYARLQVVATMPAGVRTDGMAAVVQPAVDAPKARIDRPEVYET